MPTTTPSFHIRQAAATAGVSPSTLRAWERRGLVAPAKTRAGHRRYTQEHIDRIRDIQRLRAIQRLNFPAIEAALGASTNGHGGASPSRSDADLDARLEALRTERRLSVREVSRRTGLSPSFVSAVERGVGRASLSTLKKLARCYGTTLSALATPRRGKPGKVIRAGSYRALPMLGPGVRVEQLAEGRLAMDCQRFTLSPGAGSQGQYSHEGEEFIHVLAGQLEITLNGRERYRLRPGDSMYFKSTALHAWLNPGAGEAVLLWINTPPTF